MNRKRIIGVLLAVAVLLAALTAAAVALRRSSAGTGAYTRDIVDRVRFTVSPTDLTVKGVSPGEEVELTFTLSAQKTEADFYGLIRKISLSGLSFTSVRFQSNDPADACAPESFLLPAENGSPVEVVWTVTVLFTPATPGDIDFSLGIDYIAGLTEATADEHILEIPMHVSVSS